MILDNAIGRSQPQTRASAASAAVRVLVAGSFGSTYGAAGLGIEASPEPSAPHADPAAPATSKHTTTAENVPKRLTKIAPFSCKNKH